MTEPLASRRIVRRMLSPIDEATAQFLETAADDLQRQLSIAGVIERIEARPRADHMWIVATIRVGTKTAEVEGIGDSLLTAYADLRRRVAEPTLIAALANLYDSLTIQPR